MKQQTKQTHESLRVIRFPELYRKVGLCRSQIWRLEKMGGFPPSIQLGRNSIGWIEADVDEWLNERRMKRYG